LPRQPHNAPLHLFSARPELVAFGSRVYRRRSEKTSLLLSQLAEELRGEDSAVVYTMKDFERDYMKKHLPKLTPQERQDVLQALPVEERLAGLPPEARLAGLSVEQIRQYLDQVTAGHRVPPRKPRRKK
jgi:hypothetical protein